MVNHTITSSPNNDAWLIDFAISHHITSDLLNLFLHHYYEGLDDVVLRDGLGYVISNSGLTDISFSNSYFSLTNVLCVPSMQKNLIFVYLFCKPNNTSIEFFPFFFIV